MSFTSILCDEKTPHSVRHKTVETSEPGRGNYAENSGDSYLHDHSRFPHTVHEIAKRNVKPDSTTSVPGNPPNNTNGEPASSTKANIPVNDWKYEKASIAASSIFSAVALAVIILLCVTMVKKYRRRQRRKKEGDRNSLDERTRKRESMMYSKNSNPCSYMIEEQKDGKVVRVFCMNPSKPRPSIVDAPLQKIKSAALSMRTEASHQLDGLSDLDRGRSGSIPKQIVVVSSPLRTVPSRSAVPESQSTEPTVPYTAATSPMLEFPQIEDTEPETTPRHSYRRSMIRLPSIKRTISPLFSF